MPNACVWWRGVSAQTAALETVRMADVERQQVNWLWPPYIPFGKLTCLDGDPGVGKSTLTLAIAAAVTRGTRLPGMKTALARRDVLILTKEDDPEDTIGPRLDRVRADDRKVHLSDKPFALDSTGAAKLETTIRQLGIALVIIDPISAYMPEGINAWSDSQVRIALSPLGEVAACTGAAILFLRHLTKGKQERAMYRGTGSIAFVALSRSQLLVGRDPNNEDRRIMAHAKCNLAPLGPSIAYVIDGEGFRWDGVSSLGAEDLVVAPDPVERSKVEEAKDFLRQALAGEPVPSTEVFKQAKDLHISTAAVRRAKTDLKVKSVKIGKEWYMGLAPEAVGHFREMIRTPPSEVVAPA